MSKIKNANLAPKLPDPSIIEETVEWRAIEKPRRMHSVKQRFSKNASVQDWILENWPEASALPEAGLVHRLDFETSGVLLAAKTLDTYHRLRNLFAKGPLRKFYFVLAKLDDPNQSFPKQGEFSAHFSSRYKGSKKVSVSQTGKPQERGHLKWQKLRSREDLMLLEVELLSPGRRHQIRASFAELHSPILGDALYGSLAPDDPDLFGLHSSRIIFDSTIVQSPWPRAWEVFLR